MMNLEVGSLAFLGLVGCIFVFLIVFWRDLVPADHNRMFNHTARRPYKSHE